MTNRLPTHHATTWGLLDLTGAPSEGPVAFRDELSPTALFDAYRHGLFPFPASSPEQRFVHEIVSEADVAAGLIQVFDGGDPYSVAWCSPDPRPVIFAASARIQRSLRQQLRNKVVWTTTLDRAFERVVEQCRADRESQWLTDDLVNGVIGLREAGHAHSVEVWEGEELVGGTFGVLVGGVFSADSQFTRRSGAGKVAVFDLMRRLADAGGIAVDAQHDGAHARLLGAAPIPRADYLALLREHAGDPVVLSTDALPAARLAA
ncbi:leucyl/phenylalanyl-tRNA--protein transferase [Saccharothrix texasensis]|nr:leucyl/phenylalanyl-tRNA--protein transferase [Saccharothrix texasensis]